MKQTIDDNFSNSRTFHHSFHQGLNLLVLTDILIDRDHKTHLTDRFLFSDHMKFFFGSTFRPNVKKSTKQTNSP